MKLITMILFLAPTFANANVSIEPFMTAVQMKLGTELQIPLNLRSADGFAGTINLSVDRRNIDMNYQAGNDVEIAFNRNRVDLGANLTEQVTLTVRTKGSAPSFDNSSFDLIASNDNGQEVGRFAMPYAILAVYEVRLFGGSPNHEWSSPNPATEPVVALRRHTNGVAVEFVNYDVTQTHVIHGQGAIPHGDTGRPLMRAPSIGVAGGMYRITIANSAQPSEGQYYCHNHESGQVRRTIRFNSR